MEACVKDSQENVVPGDHCAGIQAIIFTNQPVQNVDHDLGQLIGTDLKKKWGVLLCVCAVACITHIEKGVSIVNTVLDMWKTGQSGIVRQTMVPKKLLG